jgi:hypothetical protein
MARQTPTVQLRAAASPSIVGQLLLSAAVFVVISDLEVVSKEVMAMQRGLNTMASPSSFRMQGLRLRGGSGPGFYFNTEDPRNGATGPPDSAWTTHSHYKMRQKPDGTLKSDRELTAT